MRDKREVEPDWKEGREELEGVEGGQIVIGIHCLREESIFNEIKNCKKQKQRCQVRNPFCF